VWGVTVRALPFYSIVSTSLRSLYNPWDKKTDRQDSFTDAMTTPQLKGGEPPFDSKIKARNTKHTELIRWELRLQKSPPISFMRKECQSSQPMQRPYGSFNWIP